MSEPRIPRSLDVGVCQVFNIPDENEHYIEFCYNKGSVPYPGMVTSGSCEVYIAKSAEVITVPAQSAVPPIVNNTTSGSYPAACCCWRFHTVADNQGDWYLPAAGELGYIIPFFTQHNKAIDSIKQFYTSSFAVALSISDVHWSSSENSDYSTYYVNTLRGDCHMESKRQSNYVRAFRPVNI